MNDPEDNYDPLEDPPVIAPPESCGPPEPVQKNSHILGIVTTIGLGAVALGGVLIPAFVTTGRTCGATRSAKIEWERRQRQIEQVIQEDQAAQAVAEEEPRSEVPDND